MTLPTFESALLIALAIGMLVGLLRLFKGPSLADRVMALDVLTMLALAQVVVYAIATRQQVYLDIAIGMALIIFLATVAFARYMEARVRR